jgi:hypothetical protein
MFQDVQVLDPQVAEYVTPVAPSARIVTLKGARIGFVDNSKLNAEQFIEQVAAKLEAEYGVEVLVKIRKHAPKDHLKQDDLDRLSQCNAVIQCFGDCGTSTSITVADGVDLEMQGVPTATVISTAFSRAARAQALGRGVPDLPIVEIPHPMHTATAAQVAERAANAVKALEKVLTESIVSSGQPLSPAVLVPSTEVADDAEFFFAAGWTDGLPVVTPTTEKVRAMLAMTDRDPDEFIGPIPPRMRRASLRKIAINSVLAGCRAEYFPVVLAAVEAMLDNDCQLYGIQTATNTTTPMTIVNGPIAPELDINAAGNAFGQGWRANATIGRAIQLVMRNIGGDIPGETDMATHGWPGKFTFCIAENEAESPWAPFHVDAGFKRDDSTVTVIGGSSPQNIFTYGCETGPEIMDQIVGALTGLGHNNIIFPTGPLVALAPEHAQALARDGYTKEQVKREIFERARIPLSRFAKRTVKGLHHRRSRWFELGIDADVIGVADHVEDVHVVVSGGAGIHSQFVPTAFSFKPVTRQVKLTPTRAINV